MRILYGRNVNELYEAGRNLIAEEGERSTSRDGDVSVMPCPVMSVYSRPWERVLFDPERDANPFFHLLESMWMLAGRNDAKFLEDYIADFGDRFAEKNGRIHGAYGWRWRYAFDDDQLEAVVKRLKKNPLDRRVVVQMWNSNDDLYDPSKTGQFTEPRDLPCNTHAYPRIRFCNKVENYVLDLTILCRSNDIVWGAYGANAVHFSYLQEYLAAGVGVKMGTLYQFSNNYHMYVDRAKGFSTPTYDFHGKLIAKLVTNYDLFFQEVEEFCDGKQTGFENIFLSEVAARMRTVALTWRKDGAAAARHLTYLIQDDPWRDAAEQWLDRRIK